MPAAKASSKYVLVVDLGTSGPKVGLVDPQGRVAASTSATVPTLYLPNGGAEHDALAWWSSIKASIKKVMRASRLNPKTIVAIAVTSMWSVTVPVDEVGKPSMHALSWMDLRGARYNSELMKGFPSLDGLQLTKALKYINVHGFPPSPTDDLAHMLFVKHERPEVYARTYKFLEPMDYVNLCLTGKFAGTQNTMFPTLTIDNRRLDRTVYDPWLVKMTGIDPAKLPNLLPIDGMLGPLLPGVAKELGLSPETVVTCGASDHGISAVGAGSIGDGEPAAIMGGSGHMAFHVNFKKTDLNNTMATIPSAFKDSYVFWSDLGTNGKVLDSSLKLLLGTGDTIDTAALEPSFYQRADRLAASVEPGSGDLIFLPYLNGSISPRQDVDLRGGFLNLAHGTDRAHLMRAVFEGISMNWRWLRGPAEKMTNRTFKYWRVAGGGAISDVWVQIMADVVGLPMHRHAQPRMSTMIGMGLVAFNRLGQVRREDIPEMTHFDRIFEPNPKNAAIYDRIYAQFTAAREKIRPVMHALNRQAAS